MDDLAQRMERLLAERQRRCWEDSGYRPAALLVPFIEQAGDWFVLLTQRAGALSNHAGQMAFPGGAVDDQDRDPIAAAMRETYEEIGVVPEQIAVWGLFDDYGPTSSGFYATPVVAQIPAHYPYHPNPAEIQEIVEIPLSFVLDPANLHTERLEFAGQPRLNYIWNYGPHMIWGFTARILKGLLDALSEDA